MRVADVSAARNHDDLLIPSAPSRNGGSHLDLQPGSPNRPREMLHPPPGARVEGALTNGAGTVPMSRPLTDWLRATARSRSEHTPAGLRPSIGASAIRILHVAFWRKRDTLPYSEGSAAEPR